MPTFILLLLLILLTLIWGWRAFYLLIVYPIGRMLGYRMKL